MKKLCFLFILFICMLFVGCGKDISHDLITSDITNYLSEPDVTIDSVTNIRSRDDKEAKTYEAVVGINYTTSYLKKYEEYQMFYDIYNNNEYILNYCEPVNTDNWTATVYKGIESSNINLTSDIIVCNPSEWTSEFEESTGRTITSVPISINSKLLTASGTLQLIASFDTDTNTWILKDVDDSQIEYEWSIIHKWKYNSNIFEIESCSNGEWTGYSTSAHINNRRIERQGNAKLTVYKNKIVAAFMDGDNNNHYILNLKTDVLDYYAVATHIPYELIE